MKVTAPLLISIWALLSNIVLWLTPRESYAQGVVAGAVIVCSAILIVVQLYLERAR